MGLRVGLLRWCSHISIVVRVGRLWKFIRRDNRVFHVGYAGPVVVRLSRRRGRVQIGITPGEFDSHRVARQRNLRARWWRLIVSILPTETACRYRARPVLSAGCSIESFLCKVDSGKLGGSAQVYALHFTFTQVHARARADITEAVPLVHAEFADADLDVQAVVILWIDLTC